MTSVDVAVVGGSFAGLACAASAAARGLSVAVIDQKPSAGASVRTTGIFVEEAARQWPFPAAFARAIPGVRIYSPSRRWADVDGDGYRFYATDTPRVLDWLANRAASAGAQLLWGRRLQSVRRNPAGFTLPGLGLRARFIVGADGVFSRVARCFGLARNHAFLIGAEQEWKGVGGVAESRLHCFLSPRFAPGYIGWVVPGPVCTQIGLAGRAPFRPRLADFLEFLRPLFDFRRATLVERRAGWIPVNGPLRRVRAPGVLLVGDAAGQVSPLTAGGIRFALENGDAAGRAIADHLAGGAPPAAAGGPERSWLKRLMRSAFERALTESSAEAILSAALFRKAAAEILF